MSKNEIVAAGYCRVSKPRQVDGLSLDVQQEQVENYIRSRGWKLYRIFVEPGFSAKDFERPHYREMLRHLRAGKFDVLVVSKIDRFARNIRLLLEFVENELKPNNVQLASVSENIDTTTPAGNTMFQIMGIFAAMERERISERTTDSQRKKAQTGPVGGSRLGYTFDKNGDCQIDQKSAEIVRTIFRMYVKEDMTPGQIANYLRDKNIKSVYGKFMCYRVILRIMRNEAYIGRFIYGRKKTINRKVVYLPESEWIVVERKDLAIIDKKTFDAAQNKIKKNTRKYNRNGNDAANNKEELVGSSSYTNLLERDIAVCGNCGGRMGTRRTTYAGKKGISNNHLYFCTTREQFGQNRCAAESVRSTLIDAVVEEQIGQLLGSKEYLRTIKTRIKQMSKPRNTEQKKEIAELKAKIAKINEKLKRIEGLGAATRLVESQANQKADLEKQEILYLLNIADLEMEMIQTEAPLFDEKLFELLAGKFEKTFASFSPAAKRNVIATIVKKVVIKDRVVSAIEFLPPFDIQGIGDFNGK